MNATKQKALDLCTHLSLYAWHLLLLQSFKTFSDGNAIITYDSFWLLQNKNNKEIQLPNIRHNDTPPHNVLVLFNHHK